MSGPGSQEGSAKIWWGVATIAVLGSLFFALLIGLGEVDQPPRAPEDTPPTSPGKPPPQDTPSSAFVPVHEPVPGATSPDSAEVAEHDLAPEASEGPKGCSSDEDCWAPKLADCVRYECKEEACVLDKRFCDCQSNDDCDDGITCTRDLCFRSTLKCIHLKDDCE